MHTLILLAALGGAAEPARHVVVESHLLANTTAIAKGADNRLQGVQQALAERARHAMSARLRADGRVEYLCDSALPDLRGTRRDHQEER